MTASTRAAVALLALLACAGPRALAQGAAAATRVQPEVRADLVVADRTALEIGGGLQVPLGYYVRVGAGGTVGTTVGADPRARTGRADLLVRFLLDPFRQSAWGLSAGGGLGARFGQGERATPLLLLALEAEGRRSARGWSPAVQLGLGGGVRLGLVLRRGEARAR